MTDPERPFVGVRHRRQAARTAGAFALGFVAGAAACWIVVLAASYLRP